MFYSSSAAGTITLAKATKTGGSTSTSTAPRTTEACPDVAFLTRAANHTESVASANVSLISYNRVSRARWHSR